MAYQLALQAQKSRTMAASAASMIETKSSKPVPKPRVGMRKSAVRAPPSSGHPRARVEWPQPVSSHSLAPVPGEQPTYFSSPPTLQPLPRFLWQERAWSSRGCCARLQEAPCDTLCLSVCLLCSAPQVPVPPDSRCCHCHTCTTHRPSYLPLPSVSPGVKVFLPPAVLCVRLPEVPVSCLIPWPHALPV